MCFVVIASAVAIQADIVILASLALKAICLDRIHVTLIARNVLMNVVLQLKARLQFLNDLLLFDNIISKQLLIRSEHFNLCSETCYAIVILDFTLFQNLLATLLANLSLELTLRIMVAH